MEDLLTQPIKTLRLVIESSSKEDLVTWGTLIGSFWDREITDRSYFIDDRPNAYKEKGNSKKRKKRKEIDDMTRESLYKDD